MKKYANEKEITDMYGKVVDILIEKASSLGQSYNGEDLIILKACNLFITDKEQFFEFAGQRMDIIPVRILVFRSWLKDHKTDLIIDTWNKYYDEQDFNIEETLLYLKALVINHNDISEKVKYFLKRKPSHEFFKSLKSNKLLSVNDPFYGDILKMVFSSFALDQKELILEELTNSKLKLDLCMDIKQVYEQTELFYKFFTEFFSVDEDRFIMKYQSCIIELYVGEQSMSKLLENLRLLENIPMGRFYIHHVIDYITSSYSLNYNNRIQLMDYQKRLELGR